MELRASAVAARDKDEARELRERRTGTDSPFNCALIEGSEWKISVAGRKRKCERES